MTNARQLDPSLLDPSLLDVVDVFAGLQRRMHCPGCPMAPFMTLAEAAARYGVGDAELLGALCGAAAAAAAEAGAAR